MGVQRHRAAVLVAAAWFMVSCVAYAGRGTALVVHSYHPALAWTRQCTQGIDQILEDVATVRHVYLDTKRIPEPEYEGRADEAMAVFRSLHPDVVMLADDNALRLLGPPIASTGVPVVYLGINNNPREYFDTIPANVTGVIERVPLFPWIRYLREIMPEASRVLVLMDASPTSRAILDVNFGPRKAIVFDGGSIEYKLAAHWDEWRRTVLGAGIYDLIVMPVFHALEDESGNHIPVEEVVGWTSTHTPVPVFANQDYAVCDDGVAGAYVIQGEPHARLAAGMAKAILSGVNPASLPLQNDHNGTFYFNKKQLRRFGLTVPGFIRAQAIYQ